MRSSVRSSMAAYRVQPRLMAPSRISRTPHSITTLTIASNGLTSSSTPSAMDSRLNSSSTHHFCPLRLARSMAEPMRLQPSTRMNRPNTMGRKLATTSGLSSVKMPSPTVMTPPTSIKGAVKPVPRSRAYWNRQTAPVISTTTPKA